MTHLQDAYSHADKAIAHYQKLLAGSLSPAQRQRARLELIRMVFARAAALRRMEEANELVAA